MNENYCNNCGKLGHIFNQCKIPITSFGVIAFRIHPTTKIREYLMICRKDTLGYIDFMRGKYSLQNKQYLMNMLRQMTVKEKEGLLSGDFMELWYTLWGKAPLSNKYKLEETFSREKYETLMTKPRSVNISLDTPSTTLYLPDLIEESKSFGVWEEQEWGFPKGRRNYQESDYNCAVREFCEETGYQTSELKNIQNILPYEEIFTGSNYKSYKHKYYIMYTDYAVSQNYLNSFEKSEVSKIEWKSFEKCVEDIRPYNVEKIKVITNIHACLHKYGIFC